VLVVPERVLLVINRSSATGHTDATVDEIRSSLAAALGQHALLQTELVSDHPGVTHAVCEFLAASDKAALVIAGGGGGTLRAVIEGLCSGSPLGQLPARDRVRIAALRMGSGNVLAKQFGVPKDPRAGIDGIAGNLKADRTVPCCVMRIDIGRREQEPDVRYAATLGGLGQFGRIPGDLARWHGRWPSLHRLGAKLFGIERLTDIEYGVALLIRSVLCALRPRMAEEIEIALGDEEVRLRLLAGAIMNFELKALPFEPGVRVDEPSLSVHLIPYQSRLAALALVPMARRLARGALQRVVAEEQQLEIRLLDRESAEFFLDEDPMTFYKTLAIQPAGALAFVPGPLYTAPDGEGGEP